MRLLRSALLPLLLCLTLLSGGCNDVRNEYESWTLNRRIEQLRFFYSAYGQGTTAEDLQLLNRYVQMNERFLRRDSGMGRNYFLVGLAQGNARLAILHDLSGNTAEAMRHLRSSVYFARLWLGVEVGDKSDTYVAAEMLSMVITLDEHGPVASRLKGARMRYLGTDSEAVISAILPPPPEAEPALPRTQVQ